MAVTDVAIVTITILLATTFFVITVSHQTVFTKLCLGLISQTVLRKVKDPALSIIHIVYALILKEWSPGQQHQHPPRTWYKCRFSGLTPDLLDQKL